MPSSHIVATSGGFVGTPYHGSRVPGATMRKALSLSGKDRPRVLFVMTASGDNDAYLAVSYQAMSSVTCDVDHLALFSMPNQPVDAAFGRADVVWVGGGSVANMLACWRLHGVDTALRDAWERGVVLAGVSAGSICWYQGGTTDSFGPNLVAVTDGLALLPYGNGVHYDSEAQRRPLVHRLVGDATLPETHCTDDGVGLHYVGTELVEVISDRDTDPATGPAAYVVERVDGAVVETRLAPGPVS